MIYVGIDIAKNSHVAAIVSSNGEVLTEPFSFDNTIQGFALLLNSMSKFDKNEVLIGLEATGHYGENLIQFLFQREYNIVQLNPLQTASARKSSIRKTKTDKADTFAIIKVLMYEDVHSISAKDIDHIALRSLCNARRSLVTLKSRSKIQLVSYVDQVFPELSAFFKNNLHINTSYTLLSTYSSPQEIKDLHLKHLSSLLTKASQGRYGREKAIALRKLAAVSVGINNPIICLQIKLAIQQIQFFMSQLEVIESQMKEIVQRLNSRIMTIPGLNAISTAPILSIIGDFSRFSSPKQIIAYAGLDPTVIQSGQFQARYTRMSKRGNSLLRYALILSAFNVVKYDPIFKAYYDKKRAEGKSHYNALGHTASKLVRVMYALVMNGSDYKG